LIFSFSRSTFFSFAVSSEFFSFARRSLSFTDLFFPRSLFRLRVTPSPLFFSSPADLFPSPFATFPSPEFFPLFFRLHRRSFPFAKFPSPTFLSLQLLILPYDASRT